MTSNVECELARDLAMLAAAATEGRPAFRVWRAAELTVVVGRGVDVATEVNVTACTTRGVAVQRRMSGGRSVVVGPGTIQYALAFAHVGRFADASIRDAKTVLNGLLLEALEDARVTAHASGDLVIADRKIAGLALKRTRSATLVHGTMLLELDIGLVEELLRHPVREPEYRRGRTHAEFLTNYGELDATRLEQRVKSLLAAMSADGTARGSFRG